MNDKQNLAEVGAAPSPEQLDVLVEEFVGWWHLNREGSVNRTYDYLDKMTKKLRAALEAAPSPEPAEQIKALRARVWGYMNEDEHEYAVDIMEDFLKFLGSSLPHKESDLA